MVPNGHNYHEKQFKKIELNNIVYKQKRSLKRFVSWTKKRADRKHLSTSRNHKQKHFLNLSKLVKVD